MRLALRTHLGLVALLSLAVGLPLDARAIHADTSPPPVSSGLVRLARHTIPFVQDGRATFVRPYNPDQMLRLALGLQPPHLADEEQFLRDVQDRRSPLFHHFLTAAEWNARFAPTIAAEQAVVDWVISQGLTVTHRYPNRLMVDLAAPVRLIDSAFHIRLNTYHYLTHEFFANDSDPQVPANLAGIIHAVIGLSSLEVMRPAIKTHGLDGVNTAPYTPGPSVAWGHSSHGDGNPRMRPTAGPASGSSRVTQPSAGVAPLFTNGLIDPNNLRPCHQPVVQQRPDGDLERGRHRRRRIGQRRRRVQSGLGRRSRRPQPRRYPRQRRLLP